VSDLRDRLCTYSSPSDGGSDVRLITILPTTKRFRDLCIRFRLLLACAAWTAPPDPGTAASFPGPMGVRIVSGTLLLGGDRKIGETGCTIIASGQLLSAGADDQAPSGILFGLLPAGADLWQPVGGGSSTSSVVNVTCGSI